MTHAFIAETATEASRSGAANRRAVSRWLGFTALLILALVIVGGMTRLTDSGLSITEWKPIHGVIPPLSEVEWSEEFEKYKQIPEYAEVNADMDLSGFKRIFWWEWAHRFLARFVGAAFALPLAFFWLTGRSGKCVEAPAPRPAGAGRGAGCAWLVDGGVRPDQTR